MLSKKEIRKFLEGSVAGKISVDEQVQFLADFTPEKITAERLKIFADFMLKNMAAKLNMPGAIDLCGTGGSGLQRINTSTIAAFILAELGLKMAKHGNKAASGRCGSFDLLESLGIKIEKNPFELEQLFQKKGLAFIFARNFHPVMKFFAEARKVFGKPTIFNILGPLLNPASPQIQIIGTSFKGQMRLIAGAAKLLGKKKVMIVRGRDGLDEVTLTAKTDVVELKNGRIFEYTIGPEDFGLRKVSFGNISGGDIHENTKIALGILGGGIDDSRADLVYINCALVLKMVGKVKTLRDGYLLAKNAIGKGKLAAYKGDILEEIAASKILKKSTKSFLEALNGKKKTLIAEIKFASPGRGKIYKSAGSAEVAVKIARLYEKYGVSAISVLTDEKYFHGSFDYLKKVSEATSLPVLCKDFIISEYQIFKAREHGADVILLIAVLLTVEQIERFLAVTRDLGMEAIVEIHDEDELEKILKTSAKIIGINNRNLKNFTVDFETTNRLVKKIPKGKIIIAESGIEGRGDLKKLDARIDAVLIGTALMGAKNIIKKIHEFT